MPADNVELAQRLYPGPMDLVAMFSEPSALAGVRAAFSRYAHPDFESVPDSDSRMLVGLGGREEPLVGMDGLLVGLREWLSEWESWLFTPREFVDAGQGRVLVLAEIKGVSKVKQLAITTPGANILTFSDEKLSRLELFIREADALEATGLAERGESG